MNFFGGYYEKQNDNIICQGGLLFIIFPSKYVWQNWEHEPYEQYGAIKKNTSLTSDGVIKVCWNCIPSCYYSAFSEELTPLFYGPKKAKFGKKL